MSDSLRQLAEQYGLLTGFHDNNGNYHDASPEALIAVLRGLGASIQGPEGAADAIRERATKAWQRRVEPVQLYWDGNPVPVRLRLPANLADASVHVSLRLESGETFQWAVDLGKLPAADGATVEGQRFVAKDITLVYPTALGYHRLSFEFPDGTAETMILSSPTRAGAQAPSAKTWGVFAPLYAVHSRQSWGAGDFGDLERLHDLVGGMGGGLVATLPLLAAFLDEPFEPGPYSPASRLFWNEFFLDVTRIPEFDRSVEARTLLNSPEFQQAFGEMRAAPLVDYRRQMALKRRVLELLVKVLLAGPSDRRSAFEMHVAQNGELQSYARFRAVVEKMRTSWRRWPARLRDGTVLPGDFAESNCNYHLYVQWLCDEQLRAFAVKAKKSGPGLYLDLPLGVNPDSYDIWRERTLFVEGMAGGAPPDPFFTAGQNWGFPPQHPQRMRETGYRYLRACLAHHMQFAGLLRIDHLMGLHRLYWIPQGMEARQGIYVRYPSDELYAVFNLEAHRHNTVLIGEDLGTVPPEVPAAMDRHGYNRMYVLQYYLQPRDQALEPIFTGSVGSVNTHDMPAFAGFCRGVDIDDRIDLGLLTPDAVVVERARREQQLGALVNFLRQRGFLKPQDDEEPLTLYRACLEFLSVGPARVVLATLEDLWCETQPQNVPGTWKERPNWRRKARLSLEEIDQDRQARAVLRALEERVHPGTAPHP